ncbi:hypothetical protein AwDysgo_01290 [Bacteroidales bacterium]|nr:hypothetical protein AwDysgo_01290 [Bacteroidales bacterium]
MKLFFTTVLLASSFAFAANAQMLASFEDEAADQLILNVDFWYDDGPFIEGGKPAIMSNPSKSGLNTSDKCIGAINVADADWWGNFMGMKLKSPIIITEDNRYVKFLAYRSIQPKAFRLGVGGSGEVDKARENSIYENKLAKDGEWVGVVADLGLKYMGKEIEYFSIILSCNWDDPREGWGVASYYFDNFEFSDKPLPPGVEAVDGTGLEIGFESQAQMDQWVSSIDLLNENNTAEIIDNPFATSEINADGKVVKFNKSEEASWWQGYRMDFQGTMKVGEDMPSFVHMMVNIPADAFTDDMISLDVQLCAKDHMGNENIEVFTIWDNEVDIWTDLVMELNKITYLKELTVRFDIRKDDDDEYINSPANIFYLDAIAFDKNGEQRTKITTGILNNSKQTDFARVTGLENGFQVQAENALKVQLFNTVGTQMLTQNLSAGSNFVPVQKGLYILRLQDSKGNSASHKVLVK